MFGDIKAFLLSLYQKLHAKKLLKRFAWLIVICLLTLLLPLTIAFAYMHFIEETPKVDAVDVSVELFDSSGNLIADESTQEDLLAASQLAKILYDLSNTKVRVQKPAEFAKKQTLSFNVIYGNKKSTYKCYFEEDVSKSYIEDNNGDFFSPDPSAYDNLLNSYFGEKIYKDSIPPILYTTDKTSIIPNEVEWNYLRKNGDEAFSGNYDITDERLEYRAAGAINLEFSRKPTQCSITVHQTGDMIHTFSSLDELSKFTASTGEELHVHIDAEWEASKTETSFGRQRYEFTVLCSEPSIFTLSQNEAFGGEFIIISISNVENIDSISYTPSIPEAHTNATLLEKSSKTYKALDALYNYKPVFAKYGSLTYALLPVPAGIPDMTFDFSLSCGISRADFSLNLKAPTATDITLENGAILTSAQKAEFSRIVFSLKDTSNNLKLFDGEFLSPEDHGFKKNLDYNTAINSSFDLLANNYSAEAIGGTSVLSLGAGRIMQVGRSELLGEYVIVDHGLSLCTWYCGLSDVNVSVGDTVKKGDAIGKAGSSSLLCDNGMNLVCSVGEVLVDPKNVINKTIIEKQDK